MYKNLCCLRRVQSAACDRVRCVLRDIRLDALIGKLDFQYFLGEMHLFVRNQPDVVPCFGFSGAARIVIWTRGVDGAGVWLYVQARVVE